MIKYHAGLHRMMDLDDGVLESGFVVVETLVNTCVVRPPYIDHHIINDFSFVTYRKNCLKNDTLQLMVHSPKTNKKNFNLSPHFFLFSK